MGQLKAIKYPIDEIFNSEGIAYTETNSGQIILDKCYNCGRAKKFYVNPQTGMFMCFRCGEQNDTKGGPIKLLMNVLGCSYDEAKIHLFGEEGAKSIYEDDEEFESGVSSTRKHVELPKPIVTEAFLKPLSKEHSAGWNYLINRGLDDATIEKMNILHNEYARRIVFTVTLNGQLYGTLARDYTGTQEPKVLNSKGGWRRFFVWNYDQVKDSDDIVICEGVMSAAKCGVHHAIATLGKFVSDEQVKLIRQTKAKKVYICLDVGTQKEQENIYSRLSIFYPDAIFNVDLPHVIDSPKLKGKQDLCLKINNVFKTNLKYIDNGQALNDKTYFMDYEEKEKILKLCGINTLMDTEEKEKAIYNHIKKSGKTFPYEDIQEAKTLILKSEYKDAGDYSFSEMEAFIAEAKPFEGGLASRL
jgi:hypothetical protein